MDTIRHLINLVGQCGIKTRRLTRPMSILIPTYQCPHQLVSPGRHVVPVHDVGHINQYSSIIREPFRLGTVMDVAPSKRCIVDVSPGNTTPTTPLPLIPLPTRTTTAITPLPPPPAAPRKNSRLKGTSFSLPIMFGTIATPVAQCQTPLPDSSHTHKWTVFFKSENTDMSYLISHIEFKLHESFAHPVRSVAESPYEVCESGWGEFEIGIKLFFVPETHEKCISFVHHLQLYSKIPLKVGELPGIVENVQYDELVFNDPLSSLYGILMQGKMLKKVALPFDTEMERREIAKLVDACCVVDEQFKSLKRVFDQKQERFLEMKKARAELAVSKEEDDDDDDDGDGVTTPELL